MKKNALLVFFLALILQEKVVSQNLKRVLFIGNSYTAVNNLPQLVSSVNNPIYFDSNTPGGYTLNLHSTDPTTLAKIALGNWDYVVLQAQSQEPSFSPAQVANDVLPYAHKLDSLIHVTSPCAETVFYMTWGRKNGDASNCANYPPICTYAGMQARLRSSYLLMGQQNNASVAPVGAAWREAISHNPGFDLYQADESHPSIYGSYLAACVLHSTIFQSKVIPSSAVIPGISAADKLWLEQISNNLVFDSVQTWYASGNIPFVSFSYQQHQDTIQLLNHSLNASSYSWTFITGNGTFTSNQQNPYVIDPAVNGDTIFTKLVISNNCKSDSVFDTLYVLPNAVPEIATQQLIQLVYDSKTQELKLLGANHLKDAWLEVYALDGKLMVKERNVTSLKLNLKKGIYLARFRDETFSYPYSSKFEVN